ncbi:hypothetical protein BHE74_00017772 [Ensete ventricosum]|nr:hypothetical protein BHE74_00017772 [Ensete ventricosum]RZS02415.1 hypothetical protein BHM03_00032472 [Ensete ventricosum]
MNWQAMPQHLKLEPYVVHTTFQFAGSDGKRHRLREAMLFYDQPAYYDTPGILSSHLIWLICEATGFYAYFFQKLCYVLTRCVSLQEVSYHSNLVMPRLWCRFERMWFEHPGILEGTLTKQPFVCPMGHLFEVIRFVRLVCRLCTLLLVL